MVTAMDRRGKVAQPFTSFVRPDRCANLGHPGWNVCPYDSTLTQTVCLCGERWERGDAVDWSRKGGEPLISDEPRPDGWAYPVGKWCSVPTREPQQLDLFEPSR